MRTHGVKAAGLAATVLIMACAGSSKDHVGDPGDAATGRNVFLAEWTGPHGGVPAFDRMDLAALKPALEAGMAKNLAEIDAIAANADPPTFENTIVAMERAGRDLDRVMTYWGIWSSNLSTPEFRTIQAEMAPKSRRVQLEDHAEPGALRADQDRLRGRGRGSLRPDQQRLVWLVYDDFAQQRRDADGTGEGALRRDQQGAGRAAHQVRQQRAGGRGGLRPLHHEGPARRPPRLLRPGRRGGGREGAQARGRVRDHQHTLVDGSRSSPTPPSASCARRSGGPTTPAATMATSTTTTP